jgi:NhaP-type Na+/H+ or K+/H+ antiporter
MKIKHAHRQMNTGLLVAFAAIAVGTWLGNDLGTFLGIVGVFVGGVMTGSGATQKQQAERRGTTYGRRWDDDVLSSDSTRE